MKRLAGIVFIGITLAAGVGASVPTLAADAEISPRLYPYPRVVHACPRLWSCVAGQCGWRSYCHSLRLRCPDGYGCYPLYGAYGPYGGYAFSSSFSYRY
jgi:hypothetical protein